MCGASVTEPPCAMAAIEAMTVCAVRCSSDCKTYHLPLMQCFSPPHLFPGDPQWGAEDVRDTCNATHLHRTFFASGDSSCTNMTDSFIVPLSECVGPFGKPRPWGTFTCGNAWVPLPPPPPTPPPPPPPPPPPSSPPPPPEHDVAISAPCCKTCKAPAVKFFSVDVPHGPACGETCLPPSEYPIFKLFESNLTRYRGSGPSPCAEQFTPWGTHYTTYNETVTHGVWPLTVTLDIYAPVPQRSSLWSGA